MTSFASAFQLAARAVAPGCHMVLRANGIETLIMLGYASSSVVLSTTRYAADCDYRIILVEDCCVDSDVEVHDFLMHKVFPRRAGVVQSAAVIKALGATGGSMMLDGHAVRAFRLLSAH